MGKLDSSREAGTQRTWLGRGVWATLDQGLFSLSALAVNVALARQTSAASYGAFVATFSAYLLALAAHTALWSEPLTVLMPGRFRDRESAYFRAVWRSHTGLCLLLTAATGLAYLIAMATGASAAVTRAILGLAIAAGPLLTLALFRRLAYARLQPELAAAAGLVNLLIVGAAVCGAHVFDLSLGVVAAFVTVAVGAAVASVLIGARLRLPKDVGSVPVSVLVRRHWILGRWTATATFLNWVMINSYYLLLPKMPGVIDGLELSGALRALFILIMPAVQVNAALGSILLPSLSRAIAEGRRPHVERYAATLLTVGVAYGVVIGWVLGRPLLALVYDGKFDAWADLLLLLAAYPAASGIGVVCRGWLLATERPRAIFFPGFAGALASLGLAFGLTPTHGLWGIVVAMVGSASVQSLLLAWAARSPPPAT